MLEYLVKAAIASAVLAWLRQLSATSDLGGGRLGWRRGRERGLFSLLLHHTASLSRLHLSLRVLAWRTPDLSSSSEDRCPTLVFPVFTFTPPPEYHMLPTEICHML